MKRILLPVFLFCTLTSLKSQNLSFTCPRDTVLGCGLSCFTLKAKFPDIRTLSDDYTLNNISAITQCYPQIPPDVIGPSTNLTIDDRYSAVIPIGFSFPFYGLVKTSLVVSANGYLSFDLSRALQSADWDLSPGNVPNSSYDADLIMGPWHDLDPSENTSPNQQIKYNLVGTAPNRKFVLSYYKVPLFGSSCNTNIENTHQIILYESSGVIEVFIKDKQPCIGWNLGRAMVGLQNSNYTKAIMAPGRAATDPPWGSIGMNETWRFIPKNGAILYRGVQLLDGTGAVVATGDTTRININTFETTFPNVCPPANTSSIYVVKTTYVKIDDPTATIYSLDTINVLRQNSLPFTTTTTPTTCGNSSGTITVNVSSGTAPYQYSVDGGALQPLNVLSALAAGSHSVYAVDATGCNNTIPITVTSLSSLPGSASATGTSCPGVNNGTMTVTPGAGTAPYTYSIDGGPAQPLNIFTGLTAGAHTVTFTDANVCTGTVTATVTAGASITSTSFTTALSCPGANNGTATITPTTGIAPYTYSIDGGTFQASNVFTGLTAGTHTISILDVNGCTGTRTVSVGAGAGGITSTATSTNVSCPGVNNGTITITPTNGTPPYTYQLDGGPQVPTNIFTGLAAGSHSIIIRDLNSCAGNKTIVLTSGAGIGASASSTGTSCTGVSNGTITVTPTSGTAPYSYSIDGGSAQLSSTFTGVTAGSHNVTTQDANGCTTVNMLTVSAGAPITGSATSTGTSCPGVNNGTITVNPATGTAPFSFSIDGGPAQPSATFSGLTPGAHALTFTDVNGCSGTTSATVATGVPLNASVSPVNPQCANINDGTITVTPSTGTAPYQFTLNGGPSQVSNIFNGLAPGTYTIGFTDAVGCNGTTIATLTTNPPITTSVILTQPLCNGGSTGSITLNPGGGVPGYTYSLDGGATTQPSATLSGLSAGTYTIRITDNAGCTRDTTVVLGEPTLLTASATSTPSGCAGTDGTITITGNGGTGAYQYSIDNGVNYQAGTTFTAPAVGPYLNIKVKDANGCVATTSTTVLLIDNMFLDAGTADTICAEQTITLNPVTNPETNYFRWTPVTNIVTDTSKNPLVTPLQTITYKLYAQWAACSRIDSVTITVLRKPVPDAGSPVTICDNDSTVLTGTATNLSGTVNFVWSPASLVNDDSSAVTIAKPGSTQLFILTVTDNYGCNFSVKDSVLVTVRPPVPAFAGRDTIAILNMPHQLTATGGTQYIWNPSGPLSSPFSPTPLATLSQDTRFTVEVTDIAGCIGFDTVFIKVYEGPAYYMPNAFSPNGDGLNDVFRAIPVGISKTEWFRIFNRYGELIFETNQWLKGWDGSYKGKKQPAGVYIWIIKGVDKDGKPVEMKGTVLNVQ